PTTPLPAPPIGCDAVVTHNHTPQPIFPLMTRHTVPGTLLRAPMLSLPVPVGPVRAGQVKVLPVGLTVQGLPFQDERVLATGRPVRATWPRPPVQDQRALAAGRQRETVPQAGADAS